MPIDQATPNPWKSPSYPQRVHIREKAKWKAVLTDWEGRIDRAKRELEALPPGTARMPFELAFSRMLGGRDQIADAAARMPMEVGPMYEEDHHRLEEAVAALKRLFLRWAELGGASR